MGGDERAWRPDSVLCGRAVTGRSPSWQLSSVGVLVAAYGQRTILTTAAQSICLSRQEQVEPCSGCGLTDGEVLWLTSDNQNAASSSAPLPVPPSRWFAADLSSPTQSTAGTKQ